MTHLKTAALAAVTAVLGTAASANHIDFLVDGAFTLNGPGSATQVGDPGNILGAEREVDIQGNATATLPAADGAGAVGPNDAITLNYASQSNSTLTLTYDGVDDMGLGGANLVGDPGWNAIVFDFASFTEGNQNTFVDLTITDTDGDSSTTTRFIEGIGNEPFLYTNFDDDIDFMSAQSITAQFDVGQGGSFALSGITREVVAPIPLPAGLPLIAGALGVLGFVARRRRA